ncbi:hypothetical protein [Hymenobacter amundsenii]|uniref:hypothetical protein n=1 Tax=Hymenobacter amundsenii TaxID=2006685 RepID=UPI000F846139|nr:hypothetical protein [Hymenobacter amundsenii]
MTRSASSSLAFAPLVRRMLILASSSLLLALLLIGYLFGFGDQFFGRLFGAFFVFFWLLAVTFLGAVPFVTWAAANWFGAAWTESSPVRRKPGAPSAGVSRKPPRAAVKRLKSTQPRP